MTSISYQLHQNVILKKALLTIISQPIKGTAKRSNDKIEDLKLAKKTCQTMRKNEAKIL